MLPTAIVVDDDPLARARLRDLVQDVPLVRIIGEAADADSAVAVIDALQPDVVFLDIEMPAGTGLDVARRIEHDAVLVFTTAYHDYALAAFELAAVDYLLKPFGADRFREAVERALAVVGRSTGPDVRTRLERQLDPDAELSHLFLRVRDTILPLPVGEVLRFEADGDYAQVHTRDDVHLVRLRLQDLEHRLGDRFLRVHRSHLVNLEHVRVFEQHDDSRLVAVMSDGARIVASRAKSRELRRLAR